MYFVEIDTISIMTKEINMKKSFVKKKKYSFNMLFDQKGKDGVIKKLGGSDCPYTVLVNADGTIYSKHTGQSVEAIEEALERDNFMSPTDAQKFGIIDSIQEKRVAPKIEK